VSQILSRKNYRLTHKGSAFLYLIIGLLILALVILVWDLKAKLDLSSQIISPSPSPTPILMEDTTKYWQTFVNKQVGITFKYPPGWDGSNPEVVSQSPNKNIISMVKNTGLLYTGFYNDELFNIIYNLKPKESFVRGILNPEKEKITKISSGKILTGERFVIFATDKDIKSYILKEKTIYILNLSKFDDLGVEVFENVLESSSF
jgi:hypothetical protein